MTERITTNWYACVRCGQYVDCRDVTRVLDELIVRGYCPVCGRVVGVCVNWSGKDKHD